MHWNMITNPLATAAGMLGFLGMMMHSPFDIHLAPQEIPVGPPTEFQSAFIGLLMTNRSIFAAAKLVLFMDLFFGGATSIVTMIVKTFLIFMWCVFVGAVFPRFRVEQSVRWLLKAPTAIGIIAVLVYVF
ncbi:MAG: hypothetical protein B6D63_04255 [Candidatus Latescibacteria bacterium 4484_7]|nr:MAG: hypothetical protein B6D63_04255 [Candidatus Latescibacteria bacterium 4484_7]